MVAGIGCRAGVSAAQVEAAIEAAIAELAFTTACGRANVTAIATPAAKTNEPGIQATAAAWGVPLLAISQEALEAANPATVTRSTHSMAAMNVDSVAEAAALAGATTKGTKPRLLQPRVVAGPVTCALADTTTS
jgi:cobalt-precorrin 5A hydrolase